MKKRALFLSILLIVIITLSISLSACSTGGTNAGETTGKLKWVVSSGAGGAVDTIVRGISPYVQKASGKNIVEEIRAGGNSVDAYNYVWQQPADGKTILSGHSSMPLQAMLYADSIVWKKDTLEAYIPVASFQNEGGNVLCAQKDSALKTLDDVAKASKERKLNVGIAQLGGGDHIAAITLEKILGTSFNLVPYSGGGEVLTAVMGGHIDLGIMDASLPAVLDYQVNNIAITAPARLATLPDVPSFNELGYPQMEQVFHVGIFLKEGTDEKIVSQMEGWFKTAFDDPAFQKWAKDAGKPIGMFYDRKMWTDYLVNWEKTLKLVMPDVQASMEALAK